MKELIQVLIQLNPFPNLLAKNNLPDDDGLAVAQNENDVEVVHPWNPENGDINPLVYTQGM